MIGATEKRQQVQKPFLLSLCKELHRDIFSWHLQSMIRLYRSNIATNFQPLYGDGLNPVDLGFFSTHVPTHNIIGS